MRLPNSILIAQLLSHLAPVLIVTAVLAGFVFSTARSSLEGEVGRKLRDIARIAARDVPFERVTLIRAGAEETRMVRRLTAKLDAVRGLGGVAAVSVCGLDGAVLLDTTGRRIGARCARSPNRAAVEVLKSGGTVSSSSVKEGAHFMTAYAPIAQPDGTLFAVLTVRAGAGALDVAEQMQVRLLWAAGLTVLLGALLSLALAGWITRPIRQVAATADRIGGGQYSARVTPPSSRELARLAESINTMAEQVSGAIAT